MSSHPWPESVRLLVDKFSREVGTTVRMREQLLQGKSGAFVAIVECQGAHDGVHVLKVTPIATAYADELARYQEALTTGAFSNCVPPLVGHTQDDHHHLLLMGLAGGSRIEWRPLVESLKLLGSAYIKLGNLLWSAAQLNWTSDTAPPSEIARMLGYRLKINEGRILENAAKYAHPRLLSSAEFSYREQILPNPLHFATQAAAYLGPSATMLRGPVHGDCHSGNVFIKASMEADVTDLVLIDFGCFQNNSMFFFDHGYFELATLLHQLENIGEERWSALCGALADETKLDALDHPERGWALDIRRGRNNLVARAAKTWPARKDDLKIQFYSAQVAAGLSFLNKVVRAESDGPGLCKAQYQQALVWAAFHLRRLLKLWPAPRPAGLASSVPIVTSTEVAVPAAESITDEQWLAVQRFDDTGLNVLVLSPSTRQSRRQAVIALMRVGWNLVIDFGTTPLDESAFKNNTRALRQHWAGQATDFRLINRGTLWYFANGRQDLSNNEPSITPKDWRRTHGDSLRGLLAETKELLTPSSVRVLVLYDDLDPTILRRTCEELDTQFAQSLRPLMLATSTLEVDLGDLEVTKTSADAFLDKLAAMGGPTDLLQNSVAVLPRRSEGVIRLEATPATLTSRVERDLIVVGQHRAGVIPVGRVFGVDFRRGMVVEWCELAHRLDVPRSLFTKLHQELDEKLAASVNATINLIHEPSAGGSTLGRRLAWSLMDRHPVVLVHQLSRDTASYLRDIFQYCGLPVLAVMEAETVTDSEREELLRQLREDNTRAVFLWIRRTYAKSGAADVLAARLSKGEARDFLNVYLEQVTGSDEAHAAARRIALRTLATSEALAEQRSPFFFGLTAFGENYLGLEPLVSEVLKPLSPPQRDLIAQLALVTIYTSEGFPAEAFDHMCRAVDLDRAGIEVNSNFLVTSEGHVRIPHVLIAEYTLKHLARSATEWRADLRLHAAALLRSVQKLGLHTSRRLGRMIETLFVARDLVTALESDVDAQNGSLSQQRKFSPLIKDLGSVEIARQVLSEVVNIWPDELHFSVHYARHLLYEDPKDIDRALSVCTKAAQMPGGAGDHSLIHMLGMCFRVRMEQRLTAAIELRQSFDSIAGEVEADLREALSHFAAAIDLQPSSEYGHVATIQTVRKLLDRAMQLTKLNLSELIAAPNRRWIMDALAQAEERIEQINEMPRHAPSIRAQRTISEWQLLYGNVDQVISRLRALASHYEDSDVRRALCRAIVVKHARDWAKIPAADLMTIKLSTERNIERQGVRDADVRIWLRAVRNMRGFDIAEVLRVLADWHQIRPTIVEPTFYLYSFNFVRWLSAGRANPGLARETSEWLDKTRANRLMGDRSWSYEWLGMKNSEYHLINHHDLPYDPIALIRDLSIEKRKQLESQLARVTGTIRDYKGPTQAKLDLGQGVMLRFTPQTRIVKDDEGKLASVLVSFTYDDIVGRDPQLIPNPEGLDVR